MHYKGEPGNLFTIKCKKKSVKFVPKAHESVGPWSGYNKNYKKYFSTPQIFHEPTINELNNCPIKNKGGRPTIIRNGKRGRPIKGRMSFEDSNKKIKKEYKY